MDSDVVNPSDALLPVCMARTGPGLTAVPATWCVELAIDPSVLRTQPNAPECEVRIGGGSSVGEQSCCHRETQVWNGLEDTNRRCG